MLFRNRLLLENATVYLTVDLLKLDRKNIDPIRANINSEINCATITHEVLHLVGLCDEYKETAKGFVVDSNTGHIKEDINDLRTDPIDDENSVFKLAYDCRVTSMSGINIMSGNYLAWQEAFSNTDSSKNLKITFNTRTI